MTSAAEIVTVGAGDGELRLDRWFRRHYPQLGHGPLEKLLRTGQIRVDGKRAHAGDRVTLGQAIRVPPLGALPPAPSGEARPVRPQDEAMLQDAVLHRDDAVIVLNKPPGLAVQGGTGAEMHVDRLLDGLRFGNAERPRLVHRLDKDTSGVLVIARTAAAAAFLTKAFRDNRPSKLYWAIVAGLPKPTDGRIDLPLAKLPGKAGERVRPDAEAGRRAVTLYRLVDHAGARASWLALSPLTGRTHQLRAHCAALGTPILGDGKYGGADAHLAGVPGARRLHLHARSIELPRPDGGVLKVAAPLPPHMRKTWKFLGFAEHAEDPFAGAHRRHEAPL
jgi:23S rRNA pseudouridine955/2504/2580 synthase